MARELKMDPEADMTEVQHELDIAAITLEERGRRVHRHYAGYRISYKASFIR